MIPYIVIIKDWLPQKFYHQYSKIMKVAIFGILLILAVVAQVPPTWPLRFQQEFVESYSSTKSNLVGKLWYDSERQMSRVDRTNGKFNAVCSSILNATTSCTQLVRQGKRYIIFPLMRSCCFCCDSTHGCGILKRDWLKDSKFMGKDTLGGQVFYKFSDEESKTDYWATTDVKEVPRRLAEEDSVFKDFIMNTYSQEYIADNIFVLPSYCTGNVCPETSKCTKFRSQ